MLLTDLVVTCRADEHGNVPDELASLDLHADAIFSDTYVHVVVFREVTGSHQLVHMYVMCTHKSFVHVESLTV
jgi:hypothetical protein